MKENIKPLLSVPCRACGEPNFYRLADEYCPKCLENIEKTQDNPLTKATQ